MRSPIAVVGGMGVFCCTVACGGSGVAEGVAGSAGSSGSGGSAGAAGSAGSGGSGASTACELTASTTRSGSASPSGCALLDRDTSSCRAAREAAGLTGPWLQFSCRVALVRRAIGSQDYVQATSDDRPDYASNYFAADDPCHEAYSGGIQNPNLIVSQALEVLFPLTPNESGEPLRGAIVGLALNGVGIFGNFAAPGDDIFAEARTFDRCGAHPQMSGVYHYHGEPPSISYDDARFIGYLRDGYPVYGRRDPDGSTPALDASGGHVGPTADDASDHYHYHLNLQVSTASGTAGEEQWFLAKDRFHGAPAPCTGCN